MRCHYCDAEAAYAPEYDGIRVGLCERHLKEFVESDFPSTLDGLQF